MMSLIATQNILAGFGKGLQGEESEGYSRVITSDGVL